MADNLHFNDELRDFYLVTYGLERITEVTLKEGEHWQLEKDKPKFPFNDPELLTHLDTMKDIMAEKFVTFCKNCTHGRSYISRAKAAELRMEFFKRERQELTRIQNYQESRPDLYD